MASSESILYHDLENFQDHGSSLGDELESFEDENNFKEIAKGIISKTKNNLSNLSEKIKFNNTLFTETENELKEIVSNISNLDIKVYSTVDQVKEKIFSIVNFANIWESSIEKQRNKAIFKILKLISIAEWTNWNYNAIYSNANQSNIYFTDMTLKEVMEYQKIYSRGRASSAIWKYQFIKKTLNDIIKKHNFDLNQKFTPEFQDRIAIIQLEKRGLNKFLSWRISYNDFQYKLSKEWASLPKNHTNKSYYAWDWVNKSLITNARLDDELKSIHREEG